MPRAAVERVAKATAAKPVPLAPAFGPPPRVFATWTELAEVIQPDEVIDEAEAIRRVERRAGERMPPGLVNGTSYPIAILVEHRLWRWADYERGLLERMPTASPPPSVRVVYRPKPREPWQDEVDVLRREVAALRQTKGQ